MGSAVLDVRRTYTFDGMVASSLQTKLYPTSNVLVFEV